MNLTIIVPVAIGILTFLVCAVVKRFLPRRLRTPQPAAAVPRAEAIQAIRASLEDLHRQLGESPVSAPGTRKKSAIGILSRCGISSSDIAQHLRVSRGEVDLMIQVDRRRAQREQQELVLSGAK